LWDAAWRKGEAEGDAVVVHAMTPGAMMLRGGHEGEGQGGVNPGSALAIMRSCR
jgi:hypothetical protein